MANTKRQAAVPSWFTPADEQTGSPARLVGLRCETCGTIAFPPSTPQCPNPGCDNAELTPHELSTTGTVWSFTENRYQPPPPYIAGDEFEPFAIAAVELEAEKMIVLGQVRKGVPFADLAVGMEVELGEQVLYSEDGMDHLVWVWQPIGFDGEGTVR